MCINSAHFLLGRICASQIVSFLLQFWQDAVSISQTPGVNRKSARTLTEGVNQRERAEISYLPSTLRGARRDIAIWERTHK
jgi:hypothetical protein